MICKEKIYHAYVQTSFNTCAATILPVLCLQTQFYNDFTNVYMNTHKGLLHLHDSNASFPPPAMQNPFVRLSVFLVHGCDNEGIDSRVDGAQKDGGDVDVRTNAVRKRQVHEDGNEEWQIKEKESSENGGDQFCRSSLLDVIDPLLPLEARNICSYATTVASRRLEYPPVSDHHEKERNASDATKSQGVIAREVGAHLTEQGLARVALVR